MSAPARATAGRAPRRAEEEGSGNFYDMIRPAVNGILIFFAVQSAMTWFNNDGSNTAVDPATGAKLSAAPAAGSFEERYYKNQVENYYYLPEKISPIWEQGTPMDMSVYLSESVLLPPLSHPEMKQNLVFNEENIKLGDWDDKRSVSVDVPFSKDVQNNGTLFAHIFVAKHGAQMDPHDASYDPTQSYRVVKLLTRYHPKKKVVKTKKLIGGSEEETSEEEVVPSTTPDGKPIITSYWHSNLTLNVIGDPGVLQYNTLPLPLAQNVVLEQTGARDISGRNGWYYPIVWPNEFWLLRDHMVEINSTVSSLPLHIDLSSISFFKFQIIASMDYSFKQSANNPNPALGQGASTGAELEEFKRVLIETNIYLLGTTAIVSLLHTVFEMLAFKNDISHWRNKKDNVGVSVRTILANVFMQTVIFLYLVDNSDGTSWMILLGQGFGILLEAWKITRTVDVRVEENPNGFLPYTISFHDKHQLSQLEKETKEYDEEAFKYLYWIAVPLLLAYAAYSLVYESHKSWYSFIITTLVGSVYAYGFLMMVPSLYINYKLKSVAHMPRKTMIYKLLNTFIDDLFAFTIKMPTLHRLATLRDDVIYFIALYQSWIYRVDKRRINEFGQGGDDEDETAGEEKEGEVKDEAKTTGAATKDEKEELKRRK
ncbi:cleft lip and palate transmembrane protein 1-domain-containing protein [Pyronema omphalodes]|nr:cleft lip and palate transmembrane protein 1-domain-containing protein [Pyronema omphalodes]